MSERKTARRIDCAFYPGDFVCHRFYSLVGKMKEENMLLFSDLSRGEDDPSTPATVNFATMKSRGVVGTLFCVVQGVIPDRSFPIFRKNCEGILPWWGFGTLYPPIEGRSIKQQAAALIKAFGSGYKPSFVWIDWEVEGVTWQMADEYLAILEAEYPEAEMVNYSRSEFLKRALPNRFLQSAKYNRFAKIAVHQAHYGVSKPDPLPVGFERLLWQFTDRADGIYFGGAEAKMMDMSYFDGTHEQYQARFKLGVITDPSPPVERTLEERVTNIEHRLEAANIP